MEHKIFIIKFYKMATLGANIIIIPSHFVWYTITITRKRVPSSAGKVPINHNQLLRQDSGPTLYLSTGTSSLR